jgi:prophage regulatory protein
MRIDDVTHSEISHCERIVPVDEVLHRTSLSKPTIWRMRKLKQFPEPVSISQGRKGWAESEIDRWIADRLSGIAA